MDNKTYLKETLLSRKMELQEVQCQARASQAEFNAKRELLMQQIRSIEKQLETNEQD